MSNRGKAIWVSVGLIFITLTLVFGLTAIPSEFGNNTFFGLMGFVSLIAIVFIADGCKKYLWKEDFQKESEQAIFGDNPDTPNKEEAEVEKTL
jgi:hypothetical protein